MRISLICPAVCGLLVLGGCMSPSAIMGGTSAPTPATKLSVAQDKVDRKADLAVLQEVNRHVELCHRTIQWPFSFFVDCPAKSPAMPTAAEISAMIDTAVAKAVAALKTPASQ